MLNGIRLSSIFAFGRNRCKTEKQRRFRTVRSKQDVASLPSRSPLIWCLPTISRAVRDLTCTVTRTDVGRPVNGAAQHSRELKGTSLCGVCPLTRLVTTPTEAAVLLVNSSQPLAF